MRVFVKLYQAASHISHLRLIMVMMANNLNMAHKMNSNQVFLLKRSERSDMDTSLAINKYYYSVYLPI